MKLKVHRIEIPVTQSKFANIVLIQEHCLFDCNLHKLNTEEKSDVSAKIEARKHLHAVFLLTAEQRQ